MINELFCNKYLVFTFAPNKKKTPTQTDQKSQSARMIATYCHICTQKIYRANFLWSDSFGLQICLIGPIVWFLGILLCKRLDNAVSNMPMVEQLSDKVLSNCPIFGQCCFQQSNAWFMLCPNVWRFVSWMPNSPMVGRCFFQLSNGQTAMCPTFQRLENAL